LPIQNLLKNNDSIVFIKQRYHNAKLLNTTAISDI